MLPKITLAAVTNRPQMNDGSITTEVCKEAGKCIQEDEDRDLGTACSVSYNSVTCSNMNNERLGW